MSGNNIKVSFRKHLPTSRVQPSPFDLIVSWPFYSSTRTGRLSVSFGDRHSETPSRYPD